MTPKRRIFLPCVVFLLAAAVYAEQQKPLKIDVDMVMVNASVTDSNNTLVTDLKASNFQVFEDKVEQEIRYFSREEEPLSLGIVFDVSHSMENKIALAR